MRYDGAMTPARPATARGPATLDDLEGVPENKVGEIIDGELFVSPRPASRHARASSRLGMDLGPPFDRGRGGPGGWIILFEPELHLGPGPDALVPDLAGWRRERMPEMPDAAAFTLSPDWVCEVLSPSTEVLDRVRKLRVYGREQVGHVWLINPRTETLEVYRLGENETWTRVAAHHGAVTVHAEPFETHPLNLADLWER